MSTEFTVSIEGRGGLTVRGRLEIVGPDRERALLTRIYELAGAQAQQVVNGAVDPNQLRHMELAADVGDLRRRFAIAGKGLREKVEDLRAALAHVVTTPLADLGQNPNRRADIIRRLRYAATVSMVLLEDLEKGQQERQRLDARAHMGDGDGALRELGSDGKPVDD